MWTFDNFLKNVAVNNCTLLLEPHASFFVFTHVPKNYFIVGRSIFF
jgi:hypothetical protein